MQSLRKADREFGNLQKGNVVTMYGDVRREGRWFAEESAEVLMVRRRGALRYARLLYDRFVVGLLCATAFAVKSFPVAIPNFPSGDSEQVVILIVA
jgi:hypothetical protein